MQRADRPFFNEMFKEKQNGRGVMSLVVVVVVVLRPFTGTTLFTVGDRTRAVAAETKDIF